MKRPIFYLFAFLIVANFNSCSKEENALYLDIEIYGHGGAGFTSFTNTIPANSFESIQKAIEILSADGVEIDVQIDNDNKLWLYHDEILNTQTNCSDCLGEQSSAYISKCEYRGNRAVLSLAELLSYLSSMNPKPKVSIQAQVFKRCKDYTLLGDALYKTINSYNAYDWVQIESDSPELLVLLKDSSSQFQLFFDASEVQNGITTCIDNGFNGLMMHNDDVTSQDIINIKALGLKVGLYGVGNQWQTKDALNKFPHQIQTDNIELMNRIIYN